MTRKSRLINVFAAPAVLILLILVFAWEIWSLGPGESVWGVDIERYFYPFGEFASNAFRAGHLPRWNVNLFSGYPFVADPQTMLFYPFSWLLAVLPTSRVISWGVGFHLGLAALGTYLLIRCLGGRPTGALIGATVFAFCGSITPRLFAGHYSPLMSWAWMPWTLAAFLWAYNRRSLPLTILAAVPISMGCLAGYPAFWGYSVLTTGLLALYLAARTWSELGWRRSVVVILQFGLALGVGLMLSSAQLLPTLQLAIESSRAAHQTYEFAGSLSLPVHYLLTLFAPDLFGSPAGDVAYWSAFPAHYYWELSFYVGILPLLLLPLSGTLTDWRWRFFLALGGGALLLALGGEGVLHLLMYRFIPGFSLLRGPTRADILFSVSAAVLTGLSVDRWLASSSSEVVQRLAPMQRWIGMAAVLAVGVALLAVTLAAGQSDDLTVQRTLMVSSQALRFALLVAVSYILLQWGSQSGRYWLIVLATLAVILVDLWGFGQKFLLVEPIEETSIGWVMADMILAPERHTYRVVSTEHSASNGAIRFGFLSTDGYDFFTPSDADVLRDLARNQNDRILDLLSVRYLMVAEKDVDDTSVTGWKVVSQPAGTHFYERDRVGPRAFIVHNYELAADHDLALERLLDPTLDPYDVAVLESPANCDWEPLSIGSPPETPTILGYEQERVTLEVKAAQGGMLILGDLYYPGWHVQVDGRQATVHKVDYALRGVCVPAGQHQVVFYFDPPLVRQGILLSKVGLGLVLLAVLWSSWTALRARR